MSIKLVAIDIDGTLLNEKREITADVKEAIAQAVAKRSSYRLVYRQTVAWCPGTVE